MKVSHHHFKSNKGVVLISAILFVTVLMAIAFTMAGIFLPKIRSSAESKKSVTALYAAESGLEWCLYILNKDGTADAPIMTNGADYWDSLGRGSTLDSVDCEDAPLKVVGEFQSVTRAFELNF